jgi:hypothetical protein
MFGSVGERIWAQLERHHYGRHALATFLMLRGHRLTSKALGLSTGIGVVDAVEARGVEDGRVRDADRCRGAQMEMCASLHVGLLW